LSVVVTATNGMMSFFTFTVAMFPALIDDLLDALREQLGPPQRASDTRHEEESLLTRLGEMVNDTRTA
jgi:hypothetical protein